MPNYVSPAGYKRITEEYQWLHFTERPRITAEVSYAASLGDRSENSEYIYGKKRLREIDSRLRFLGKRIEAFEVIDPTQFAGSTVRFGATVELEDEDGQTQTWTVLGEDEVDTERHVISHVSPLGRALMGRDVGDVVVFETPRGKREITILAVRFPPPPQGG